MRLLLAGGPWVSARPTSSATLDPPIPVRTGSWCHKHTTPPRRLFCERKSQYLKVIYAFDDQENIQNLIDLDLSSWINPIDFLCIISHMSEVIENNGWSQTGFKFLLIDRQQYNLLLWKGKKWLLCSTYLPDISRQASQFVECDVWISSIRSLPWKGLTTIFNEKIISGRWNFIRPLSYNQPLWKMTYGLSRLRGCSCIT